MSLAAENFQLMADKGILFDILSSLFLLLLSTFSEDQASSAAYQWDVFSSG